jgi:type VI protein secretion system component Hcp
MKSMRPLFLAGVLVTAAQTAAAAVFLFIPGVPGESIDARHRNWIDLQSMQIGVANRACTSMTVSKSLDVSSPVLSAAALTGGAYPNVTLDVTTEGENPRTFLTYVLANATVVSTSVATSGTFVTESVTLSPTTVTMTYTPQLPDGSLGAPVSFTLNCAKK